MQPSLTDEQKDQVREVIMRELKSQHRTFGELWRRVAKALDLDVTNSSAAYRATDNALQALRRRGVIEWFRFGTYKYWKLKDA